MDLITSRVHVDLTLDSRGVHFNQSYKESQIVLIQKAIRQFLVRKNSRESFKIDPLYDLVEKDGCLYCNGTAYFDL